MKHRWLYFGDVGTDTMGVLEKIKEDGFTISLNQALHLNIIDLHKEIEQSLLRQKNRLEMNLGRNKNIEVYCLAVDLRDLENSKLKLDSFDFYENVPVDDYYGVSATYNYNDIVLPENIYVVDYNPETKYKKIMGKLIDYKERPKCFSKYDWYSVIEK